MAQKEPQEQQKNTRFQKFLPPPTCHPCPTSGNDCQVLLAAQTARDANRNGDDSHTSGTGTEGVVELTQWFERMETVFRISNCSVENQSNLRKKMTDKGYNQRLSGRLALLCVRMFPEESDNDERLDPLLTKLEFPQELSKVHNTFHVSNLKKCYADEPLAVLLDGLHLDDKLHFVEEPLEIVGREVKRLKRSRIPLVKVRWNSKRGPEFTWEREDQFKKKYPHLFTKTTPSSSAAL
ncbi:hypothetical protein Tco_1080466 [Tanacetum coccineum]|uniref:Reverse transcriptase domain-containing protein n=1 Tax=Tanacetum coccineum TaxID=301880 RepID=A0ABQ5HUU7_9ASTR